jgi:hypothetical protein
MGEKILEVILYNRKCLKLIKNIIINVKRVVRSLMHGNSGVTYPFCVVKINSKKKYY